MRVLAVLWTVCLVRLCSAFLCCFGGSKTDDDNGPYGGSKENLRSAPSKPVVPQSAEQPATTPITLDLAKPDETKLDVHQEDDNGLSQATYTPKDTSKITTVMDGEAQLWTASGDEKCTSVQSYAKGDSTVMTIGIKSGGNFTGKYFEKTDGKWSEIGRELFIGKFYGMKGESVEYTGNITQEASPSSADKLPTENLGGSQDKEGPPVEVASDTALQEGENVDKPEIPSDNTLLQSSVQVDSTPIALDLTKPDESKVDILRASRNGVVCKEYLPKEGHHISSVVDGNKELWKSNQNAGRASSENSDYCLSCIIYKKGNKELLEMIVVENLSRGYNYFEKVGTEWKSLNRDIFLNKLKVIMAGSTTPSQ